MQFYVGLKVRIGFGAALLLLSVVGGVAYYTSTRLVQDTDGVQQSLRVLKELDDVPARLLQAELGQRNYLLSGEEAELEPYRVAVGAIHQEIQDLRQLMGENLAPQRRLDALESLVVHAVAELEGTITVRRNSGSAAAWQRVLAGQEQRVLQEVDQSIRDIESQERELLAARHATAEATAQQARVVIALGSLAALVCVAFAGLLLRRDMAKRVRAEDSLRESEERYRGLFENASDGIGCLTVDGIITSVNRALEAMLGWSRAEMIGENYRTFHTPSSLFAEEARLRRIHAGEKVSSLAEIELVHKDGSVVPVESRTRIFRTPAGAPIGVLATLRDITERKRAEEALRQAEEQYRSIFENALEGIFQTTPAGHILSANPAFARMCGYDSPEELKAQVTALGTQLYADPHRRAEVLEMLNQQGTVHGVESQFTRKDGSRFWVSINARAVRDATQAVRYYEGSIEDITQRRAVNQLKEEFVSLVSHELRTPLTSIRGSLGLLASGMIGPVSDKGQRMLDIAVRNTDRLVRLINDILDVERIESGKVSMVKTTCNVADLMTHALEEMRGMAEKAGVTLLAQPVQAQLWADPDRVIQTLTNLLSNAIKFSPAGTTVWLTAEQQEEGLVVQVKDQGRGIPADKLESIFERFQQVDASDSREKGGTGLGLAICRSIVHQHGGRIWAASTLGKGSVFSVMLPLSQEERLRTPAASVSPSVTPGSEQEPPCVTRDEQTRRLQVLVAEDDRDLARVLIAIFERHGAVVYYAQTGTEAILCCDFVVPDLLVLDPIMPEQDGFAVVDWMRQHESLGQLPSVVYAAGELTAVEQQRLTLGPTLFFTKSRVPPDQFERQVMHWLDRIIPASAASYW